MAPPDPTPTPTYSYGRRSGGLVLGLSARALVGVAAAVALAVVPVLLAAGLLPAVAVALVVAVVAWVPGPAGVPARSTAAALAACTVRSVRSGAPADPHDDPSGLRPLGDLEIIEVAGIGVARIDGSSQRAATWWVVPVADATLLDDDEAERVVEAWGAALDALGAMREVRSVSWRVSTVADRSADPSAWLAEHAGEATPVVLGDYGALLDRLASSARRDITVTVTVEPSTPTALDDLLTTVDRHLRASAQGARIAPLSADELHAAIAEAIRPDAATLPRGAGDDGGWWLEHAGDVQLGSWFTRTLAIHELPRTPVAVDWLWPLLVARPPSADRTTVVVHMEPVPAWRALRSAEIAVTSAESELRRRERAGFSTRARDVLALQAQTQREEEVAAGHMTWRIRAEVAVAARSVPRAERAAQDALAAARRAHCAAAVAWGRQLAGWRATVPLGLLPPAPTIEATTRQARSLCPSLAAARGDAAGLVLGVDALSGGPWTFEPFESYAAGAITSPNCVVLGQVGRGKSSFVKALCSRGSGILQRRCIVLDPKGEYAPLAGQLGLGLLALRPGGTVRLNPLAVPASLDERDRSAMRHDLLVALASAQLSRPLDPVEDAAIGWLARELPDATTLRDAVSALLDPPAPLCEALRLDETGARDALRSAALGLGALVDGHLQGMFDGRERISFGAESRGIVVDLSAAWSAPDALGPILASALAVVSSAVAATPRPTYLVVDEAWAVLGGGVDFLRAVGKLSRRFAVSLILVVHRLSDLAAAGDDASAVAKRAEGLFSDAETVVAFGEARRDAELLGAALDLSSREVDQLTRLGRGQALALVGSSHRLVEIVLSDAEQAATDTDAAMRAALGAGRASSDPAIPTTET